MSRERISLYDTTLRDGAQTHGVDFSVEDKWLIAEQLDALGLDYIEAGYPGANPTDTRLFAEARPLGHAKLTAFGMTKRPGRSIANDPGFQALLAAKVTSICLVAKSWDFHVDVALGISLRGESRRHQRVGRGGGGERARGVARLRAFLRRLQGQSRLCARLRQDRLRRRARAGWCCATPMAARCPRRSRRIVGEVVKHIPGDRLGIHVHNDTDNGVANSLAAVRAGARQIQGTLNGLGERCGNANLTSIIPTLMLKSDYAERFETSVTPDKLRTLTHASRILDEVLNRAPNRHAPYVGESAFAHKGGIHVSAVQKDPRTYEHVPPEAVGNRRRLLVSDQGGRSNILAELERIGIVTPKDDPRIARLLEVVKEREAVGYAYEAAEASFELLARRMLGNVPQFFEVESFRVLVERRHNALGDLVTVSEATVKVRIDGESVMSVGEGNGPVNALDKALRKDLGPYQSFIEDLDLVDYKVRILTGGTDAVTRVLIESRDGAGNRWFTVGVSPNIVDASFEALIDSINYKLIRDGAPLP